MTPEKGEEEFFGQIEPKEEKGTKHKLAVDYSLFSTDKKERSKEYYKVIAEAEKMVQDRDIAQLVKDKKIKVTVLNRLLEEYGFYGRPDPNNLKEKIKTALLQLLAEK